MLREVVVAVLGGSEGPSTPIRLPHAHAELHGWIARVRYEWLRAVLRSGLQVHLLGNSVCSAILGVSSWSDAKFLSPGAGLRGADKARAKARAKGKKTRGKRQ